MRRSNKRACSSSTAVHERSLRSRWAHDRQPHGVIVRERRKSGLQSRGLSCGCLLRCESSPVLAACLQSRPRPMARQPRREGSPPHNLAPTNRSVRLVDRKSREKKQARRIRRTLLHAAPKHASPHRCTLAVAWRGLCRARGIWLACRSVEGRGTGCGPWRRRKSLSMA